MSDTVTPINDHIAESLKSAVKQLKSDVDNAFSAECGSEPVKKIPLAGDKTHTSTQALKLTEYLLSIKEKQLGKMEYVYGLSNRSIIELAHLFLDSLYTKPTLQSLMERITSILHAKFAILWQQKADTYELRTSGVPITEGERVIFDVLPVLAMKDDENVTFESESNYYMAHTTTNYLDETIVVIYCNDKNANYTFEEQQLSMVLSEILFKIAQD